ncbi:murein L,D-transpeptidase catalytic domain family protein [Zunongwangia sp.]|uniref:murein L,D-transpeptidase catalytic domain family protein n=1 Tax=Zunongwangia sp. TaxID=1965325 RepID=UPI003AA809FA
MNRLMIAGVVLMFSTAFSGSTPKTPLNPSKIEEERSAVTAMMKPSFEEKIATIYSDFTEKNESMPALTTFQHAMKGYYKLLEQGKVDKKILTIIDFNLSSKIKRFWVLDMNTQDVLFNTYTAHGKNSGMEFATSFSNSVNSHKSSLGFYVTGETYYGKNGLSLFIDGMEKGYNNNARKRYVVIHGSDYVNRNFISTRGRAGRSYGCPAIPRKLTRKVINIIKGKSVIFINKSNEDYLEHSSYLNS